jgi:hypothetical protein
MGAERFGSGDSGHELLLLSRIRATDVVSDD